MKRKLKEPPEEDLEAEAFILRWWSRQESNLYLSLRSALFYPLNYETTLNEHFPMPILHRNEK